MKTQELPTRPSTGAFGLKRILVPVDFSDASRNAVQYALRLSALTKADLVFVHIIVPDAPLGLDKLPPICSDELKENAGENLRALVRAARDSGNESATSICRVGLPAHEIVEAAKETDVDLIVIATHGYTGWKHFCIGSTAEQVVRAAPCPVLVVREKEQNLSKERQNEKECI